jgi:hypothetical protein
MMPIELTLIRSIRFIAAIGSVPSVCFIEHCAYAPALKRNSADLAGNLPVWQLGRYVARQLQDRVAKWPSTQENNRQGIALSAVGGHMAGNFFKAQSTSPACVYPCGAMQGWACCYNETNAQDYC